MSEQRCAGHRSRVEIALPRAGWSTAGCCAELEGETVSVSLAVAIFDLVSPASVMADLTLARARPPTKSWNT